MIHVLVRTHNTGIRKAWFVAPVESGFGEPAGIVVYKTDKEHRFEVVALNRISLDTIMRNKAVPVIDSLRDVNLKLKGDPEIKNRLGVGGKL